MDEVPAALIVDSPWIPGYVGMDTIDYYSDLEMWWKSHRKIREDFPDVIFLPDYWVEFGMASEPSAFGCKFAFYNDRPITIEHIVSDSDDLVDLCNVKLPNPRRDGLMPVVLNYYKRVSEMAKAVGEEVKIIAARGPLNVAAHMMGVTELLLGYKVHPDEAHKLFRTLTSHVKNWLEAQMDAVGTCEGVLLLDDIIGFLSPADYMEFAHPYFKEIFDAFPLPVRMLHNDTDNPVSYPHIADMGANIFNFTHERTMSEVSKLVGDKVCLLGNIPPLHLLTRGTPEEVEAGSLACLQDYGRKSGVILSAGGGASPGMPGENLEAMIRAAKKFSAQ